MKSLARYLLKNVFTKFMIPFSVYILFVLSKTNREWDKERFLVIIRSVHFLFVCIENGGKLEYNEHVSISQIGGVSNGLSFR